MSRVQPSAHLPLRSLGVALPVTLGTAAPAASPSLCSRAVRAELTTVHWRSLHRPRRSYSPHKFNIASLSASKIFVFVSGYPPAACSLSVLARVQFWRDSQHPHCACALSPTQSITTPTSGARSC